jgi:selenocysteine-specific elongation factor
MIVGTAGHIDHGKTTLVRALTGVDTDRLKEEKARGISIDLGFAYWPRPSGDVIGFVDVPGHEGLVHTMLAGATGIDFVLLVVAADDGVMPQTREHLAIIDLLGLDRGVVALSKCDLVDPDRIEAVTAEIAALLAGTGLEGSEIVPVSGATGQGLEALTASLDAACAGAPARPADGRFRLAVDRCFTLPGRGTAVTGTVLSGSVGVGDEVVVSPAGLAARIRSIHAQDRPAERGVAGQRCALVLSGPHIEKTTVRRGDVVLDPTLHEPTARIDASLRILRSEPRPIGQWFPVKVHHASTEVPGRIVLLSDRSIEPGAQDFAQLVLERPIAAAAGDPFVIRDTSSSRTVGGGRFTDLRAPERRRRTPERRALLEALAERDPARAVARRLAPDGAWCDLTAFCRDRALAVVAAETIASDLGLVTLVHSGQVMAMRPECWDDLRDEVGRLLDDCHADRPDLPGVAFETLRRQVKPQFPAPLFMTALRRLTEAGEVALDRTWVRRPGHSVTFSREEEAVWTTIARHLASQPFRPPRVRDIAKATDIDEAIIRRVMHMASRRGDLEEIAHDHFFTRASVEEMAAIAIDVAAHAPAGKFTAADFRDRLDNGRKVAIQILEFFDRHGLTIRRGDLRRINPARIELFAPALAPQQHGGVPPPVGRPVFKTGWGRQTVSGGFDSHPPPPSSREARR